MEVARKQASNHVAFHEVKMINRSQVAGHSRAERIVDLAQILERRRTIMDAGIIRIMKRDKELAVNTLAIKVYTVWETRVCVCMCVCVCECEFE